MQSPADDELEVTLLGRGVGESVVVHLLDGRWMVVDSFMNGKVTSAQAYLDTMQVDRSMVKVVVVTHFHTDHFRGIDQLHDYYHEARLMVTDALRRDQFLALYGDDAEPPLLGVLPGTIHRASERTLGDFTPGLRHLSAGSQVYQYRDVTVTALSPTDAAVLRSNYELANAIATEARPAVKSQLKDDNRCSIALHVRAASVGVLLGGDLVADAPEYGWQAVTDDPNHQQLQRAGLVKVPHHGSVTAEHQAMWEKLVEDSPRLAVAPYWPSGIPRDADIARLCERGNDVWQAAPSVGWTTDEFGNRISLRAATGLVRARRRAGEGAWRVEAIPPAFLATPAAVPTDD